MNFLKRAIMAFGVAVVAAVLCRIFLPIIGIVLAMPLGLIFGSGIGIFLGNLFGESFLYWIIAVVVFMIFIKKP